MCRVLLAIWAVKGLALRSAVKRSNPVANGRAAHVYVVEKHTAMINPNELLRGLPCPDALRDAAMATPSPFLSATHERASDAVMRFLGFEENCPTTGILDFVGSDGASWEVVTERVVNCAEINSTEPARPARRRAHSLVDFHADHQAPDLRGGGVGEGGVSGVARARSLVPPLPPLRWPPRHFGAARGASSQSI